MRPDARACSLVPRPSARAIITRDLCKGHASTSRALVLGCGNLPYKDTACTLVRPVELCDAAKTKLARMEDEKGPLIGVIEQSTNKCRFVVRGHLTWTYVYQSRCKTSDHMQRFLCIAIDCIDHVTVVYTTYCVARSVVWWGRERSKEKIV